LLHHHKIPLNTFDELIPWEKDVYVGMLSAKVEEENEKMKLNNAANRVARKRGKG
jgi:hypothetical protein